MSSDQFETEVQHGYTNPLDHISRSTWATVFIPWTALLLACVALIYLEFGEESIRLTAFPFVAAVTIVYLEVGGVLAYKVAEWRGDIK